MISRPESTVTKREIEKLRFFIRYYRQSLPTPTKSCKVGNGKMKQGL
jgi:hypothetical protein